LKRFYLRDNEKEFDMNAEVTYDGVCPPEVGFGFLYKACLSTILNEGKEISPRGKKTLEVRPVLLQVTDPLKRVTTIFGRKNNTFFNIVEAIWLLAGRETVDPLAFYASNIAQFSDDGMYFHAPYGARLRSYGRSVEHLTFSKVTTYSGKRERISTLHAETREQAIDQLSVVADVLRTDMNSRQAVASIWNPLYDLNVKSKDIPCNDLLMFKVREDKLCLSVCNRSNDLHWGLMTNVFQFSMVLDVLAFVLDVGVGTLTHFIDSLHIYLDSYGSDITAKIQEDKRQYDVYEDENVRPVPFSISPEILLDLQVSKESSSLRYNAVFDAIENAMLAIESFESLFSDLQKDYTIQVEPNGIVDRFLGSELFTFIKKYSPYLYGLVLLVLSYFLFKKAKGLLLERTNNSSADFIDFVLIASVICLLHEGVLQEDMRISCLNFYIHQFSALKKKMNGDGKEFPFHLNLLIGGVIKNYIRRYTTKTQEFILEGNH